MVPPNVAAEVGCEDNNGWMMEADESVGHGLPWSTSGKLRKREKPEQHEFGSATQPSLTGPVQSRSNAINLTTIVHALADSLPLKNSAQ
jgi:hypothetical protein